MLYWIDCDIVYLCSHDSFSCCFGLILTLYICVLKSHPHVALDWLWHCLSMFSWLFLILHWIECDIVCLCSRGYSSCCIGLIVSLFICVFMVLPHVVLVDCGIVYLCSHGSYSSFYWIDCDIVYLSCHDSSSCRIGLSVSLFICVLMIFPHVASDWVNHCLSVFSCFFLVLHWIDCNIVYLCSHGSSSCCIGLIVTLFICVLMDLSHVALDWLWHCISEFS